MENTFVIGVEDGGVSYKIYDNKIILYDDNFEKASDKIIQKMKEITYQKLSINCMLYPDPIYNIYHKIVDNLPQNLISLYLGGDFNVKINNLPQNLKVLWLGSSFNQEVDLLPSNLKYLDLGNLFNQKVDNLPSGSAHLTFLVMALIKTRTIFLQI